MTSVQLTGLKSHHPLGFLAACGLLRIACDEVDAALGWESTPNADGDEDGVIASLDSSGIKTEHDLRNRLIDLVADSAVRYLSCLTDSGLTEAEALASDYQQRGNTLLDRARTGCVTAGAAAELLPAIGSDLVTRQKTSGRNKGKTVIANSHLLMTSGQQDLFKKGTEPARKLAKRSKAGAITGGVREKVEEALYGPWQYRDNEHPIGWDPNFQRVHALRNKAPTNDNKNRSVSAAVFLATQALPLFPCFAINGRIRTTGFYSHDGEDWFSWPIWRKPISINTLRSLLAHPFDNDLRRRGVEIVYRCRRVRTGGSEGNYQIFSHSEQRPWPTRQWR